MTAQSIQQDKKLQINQLFRHPQSDKGIQVKQRDKEFHIEIIHCKKDDSDLTGFQSIFVSDQTFYVESTSKMDSTGLWYLEKLIRIAREVQEYLMQPINHRYFLSVDELFGDQKADQTNPNEIIYCDMMVYFTDVANNLYLSNR